jgi:hypothetical protein
MVGCQLSVETRFAQDSILLRITILHTVGQSSRVVFE